METNEPRPADPELPKLPETEPEETEDIEFRQVRREPNPFLTRGCAHSPRLNHRGEPLYRNQCNKFDTFDWLKNVPATREIMATDMAEVRFKNGRKDFYKIPADLEVAVGDAVAVEASPGHDIGLVSQTGELVRYQLQRCKKERNPEDYRKIYRKARLADIEKWTSSVEAESPTMFRSRAIAEGLGLSMKINDVEIQGDGTKAIFYYTADDRVDFRELIKLLAEEFRLRIEMRQIGARQEASRLGGLGSCGRELCCCTWMNDFRSVTTNAARVQQLSLNPQKLAGQCGKLKCCLNYEYEAYVDAMKGLPGTEVRLKTKQGEAMHQKTDVFQAVMWYSYVQDPGNLIALPADQVHFIQEENRNGNIPEKLEDFSIIIEKKTTFESGSVQDDLTRFDNQ